MVVEIVVLAWQKRGCSAKDERVDYLGRCRMR